MMKVTIPTENGLLPDKYGKYASSADYYHGNPCVSFPFKIEGAPTGTKSFAIIFIDFDSTPVCGFTWIHWLACNIPATMTEIPENFSQNATDGVIQGHNSCISRFLGNETDPKTVSRYIGPQPPDQNHDYSLYVYALDTMLDLKEGYYLNELRKAMKGHVLERACVEVESRC